jgi:hypothetical protein
MSVKVTYVMNVLNGEPFIQYQLASIYPYAHEIVITEGAYGKFSHASTSDGHSTDKTLEIIANFPDPEHKITLIEHQGFWDERCEMCNGFMPAVTGDVIWQVDVDEFYLPHVHEYVSRLFDEDDALDLVSFRVREFFASPNYEVVGAVNALGLSDVRRVHRFEKGDRWITQRPPTLIDASGKLKPIRKEITAEEMFNTGMFIIHYTALFEKQFFDKFKFYRQMWEGIEQTDKWLNDTWYHFKNPLRLHGITGYASWIECYDGPCPPQVEQMIIDVRKGKYPGITFRDNSDIKQYLQSPKYHEDVFMGETLNSLLVNFSKRELPASLKQTLFIFSNYIRSPSRTTYKFCMALMLRFFWRTITSYFVRIVKSMLYFWRDK